MATCTDAQLVPHVAQLLVSQGAPGYTRLARGKEAIVRAYLTNPTTCTLSNKQAITPTSATLDVTIANASAGPLLANNDPLSGKLIATQQAYSTSDPYFVVPAAYLRPLSTTDSFTVNFNFGLTYTRTGSTAPMTSTTGLTTAAATVDKKTNALRILIVPMGDRSSGSVQWSTPTNTQTGPNAETTLKSVLSNAGRALPVPSGVTEDLTSAPTTAGIRFQISGDLLDVKALGLYKTSGSSTKFCANGATWTTAQPGATGAFAGKTLKTELQDRLDNYNLYNAPPADLVVGVIDGNIAWKTTDGITGGCDDGRAATPDPTAKTTGEVVWVRVDTGTYATPLQMELAHTLGIVDPSIRPTFHGLEVQTDAAAPDKVYNVSQRKVIMTGVASGVVGTNDHSIMNYDTTTIPYTKDNTVMFGRDWDDALCDLGGLESNAVVVPPTPAYASCTISTAVGTDAGVAAGFGTGDLDMFHIDGHLSGGVVKVNDANIAAGDGEFGIGKADSPLHLKLCNGPCASAGPNFRDVPLARSGQAPIGENHTSPGPAAPLDEFSALISLKDPILGPFTCAELKLGTTTPFSSCDSDPAPTIESTGVATPGTVLASFPMPACCNGRAVAFDGTNLYTTLASGSTVYKLTTGGALLTSFSAGATVGALAWNGTTQHLFGGDYTGNGNVYDIDPTTTPVVRPTQFTFSDDTATCEGGRNFIDGLEYRGVDGAQFAISGDVCDTVFIKKLDGTPGTPAQFGTDNNSGITTDGAGGLWLARLQTTGGPPGGTVLTRVDLQGNVLGEQLAISNYEAEDLAYDSVTFAPSCVVWMNQATEGTPQIRAVAVPCGTGASSSETAVVNTTNADFVTLFVACGDQEQAMNPEVEKFSLGTYVPEDNHTVTRFSDEGFCKNAHIIAEASNGWTSTGLAAPNGSAAVDNPPSQSPTESILSPFNGAKYRVGDNIHFEGYATDAEDGAIVATLKWYDNNVLIPEGTGQTSFDKPAPATTGNHTIKLEATDLDGHTTSTNVTISIKPKVCSSSQNCP
jgi:hypothetical protein